jgi:hypothetical protein
MEYKGFEIRVHPGYVVLGDDPTAEATQGFAAQICVKDPVQDDPDGRVIWDYPLGMSSSLVQGATEDEAVQKAKDFIDAGRKGARNLPRAAEG